MRISVITPTIREQGLAIVARALASQTFQNFEWLIGSKKMPKECASGAIWIEDDFKGGFWSLNRIYNKLFKASEGELIVSLQDFVWVTPTGLEQFWNTYQKTEGLITGVGDQYEKLGDFGKPEIKIWSDPRKRSDLGSFYEINWNDAEFNWSAIPKRMLFEIGGFDEQLDFLGRGGDQFQVCERLNEIGKHFWIDQNNESFTLRHDRSSYGGQTEWDKSHVIFNGKYLQRKDELKKENHWPKLDFLP